MKKIVLISLLMLVMVASVFADTSTVPEYTQNPDAQYRLFKTQNNWVFIKLNTCNGKLSLVQWSTDGNQLEQVLSDVSLIGKTNEVPGRFTLYATNNFFNFVMLDTYTGLVYQVQWSTDGKSNMVIPIL